MTRPDKPVPRRPMLRGSLDLLLGVGDLTIIVCSMLVAMALTPARSLELPGTSIAELMFCALLCFVLFPVYRGWRYRTFPQDMGILLMAWAASFVLLAAHMISVGVASHLFERWLLSCFFLGWTGMALLRALVLMQMHRWHATGRGHERIVLAGLNAPASRLQRTLQRQPYIGKRIVGYFAAEADVRRNIDASLPRLGRLQDLPAWLAENHADVDQVWVSLAVDDSAVLKAMLRQIEPYPLQVRLIPDTLGMGALNPGVLRVGAWP